MLRMTALDNGISPRSMSVVARFSAELVLMALKEHLVVGVGAAISFVVPAMEGV